MASESETGELAADIEAVRPYLADQPLEFALLFGSQATGTATDRSDIDVVLKFPSTLDNSERFEHRNRIAGQLMARLGRDDVDVSDLDQLPTAIAHAALQEGRLLVGDEETVDAHRREVAAAYERSADDRQRSREDLLHRLRQGSYGR